MGRGRYGGKRHSSRYMFRRERPERGFFHHSHRRHRPQVVKRIGAAFAGDLLKARLLQRANRIRFGRGVDYGKTCGKVHDRCG